MKKVLWILFLILVIGSIIFIFYKNNNTKIANKNNNEYTAQRVDTTIQNTNVQESTTIKEDKENNEEELSSFSTKLPKDTKERYSNIELACDTLNGTIIKRGETFSLWEVIGNPTNKKGYKKAMEEEYARLVQQYTMPYLM